MKRIHLARWDGPPDGLAPLIAAAGAIGLRVGWLEGGAVDAVPPGLGAASGAGAFRSVALAAGRSVAVKRLAGPPVLRDVLREHFLGCALVVVGDGSPFAAELADAPLLEAADGGYRVGLVSQDAAGGAGRRLSPEKLAERLRRVHPWD